jgi:hypothetical protein
MSTGTVLELGTRYRTVDTETPPIPFDSGNTRSQELPNTFLYKNMMIRLSGTATNGGTGPTGSVNENPLGLIRRLDLIADGRKLLWSIAGRDAFRLSQIMNGKVGEFTAAAATVSTTVPFAASFVVHNEAKGLGRPIESYFDSRPFTKVELRVQWGTVSDVWSTPQTTTINAVTQLSIHLQQSLEGVEQIAFNRLLMFDEQATATSGFGTLTFKVPRAGLLMAILLRTDASLSPSNAILEGSTVATFQLKSDNNFVHKDGLRFDTLRNRNVIELQLDTGATGGANTGYYWIDLSEDGLFTSLLNTYDLNTLDLVLFNVAGAASQIVHPTYVFFEPIGSA